MTAPAMQQTEASCPKCGGMMFDNRFNKRNPKAPDFKCKNRACDGVIWPPRQSRQQAAPAPKAIGPEFGNLPGVPMEAEQPAEEPGKERLRRIFNLQDQCFAHALQLAVQAEKAGVPCTLDGVSALTAQAFIAFKEGR
jgi:hypothetical protein